MKVTLFTKQRSNKKLDIVVYNEYSIIKGGHLLLVDIFFFTDRFLVKVSYQIFQKVETQLANTFFCTKLRKSNPISGQSQKMESELRKNGENESFSNIYFKHLATL